MSVIQLKDFDQLDYLIRHFNMDSEHAIDTMIKHKQDMSFIINKINEEKNYESS